MIKLLGIGLLFLLLFLGQKLIYNKLWLKNLHVDIRFSQSHVLEGEQGELKEIIENRKRLPLTMLKVKFKTDRHLLFEDTGGSRTTDRFYRNDVFRVGSREKVTRTLKFTGGRRGYYTIEEASLVAADLFLSGQLVADVPLKTEIYVYPRPWLSGELLHSLNQLNGEVLARRHLLEDPFEYKGIREYQPYDNMRSINWKATAKTGDFKVNQRGNTSLKSVSVYFNIQDNNILKKEDCVEMSLRIAAGLCSFFLSQGIQTSCFGNGVDVLTKQHMAVPAKAGEGQFDAVCRALARLDTEQNTADFSSVFEQQLLSGDKNLLTCFISPNQYEDFVSLLERFAASGRDFIWFYPVQGSREPEFPPSLAKYIRPVHFD